MFNFFFFFSGVCVWTLWISSEDLEPSNTIKPELEITAKQQQSNWTESNPNNRSNLCISSNRCPFVALPSLPGTLINCASIELNKWLYSLKQPARLIPGMDLLVTGTAWRNINRLLAITAKTKQQLSWDLAVRNPPKCDLITKELAIKRPFD